MAEQGWWSRSVSWPNAVNKSFCKVESPQKRSMTLTGVPLDHQSDAWCWLMRTFSLWISMSAYHDDTQVQRNTHWLWPARMKHVRQAMTSSRPSLHCICLARMLCSLWCHSHWMTTNIIFRGFMLMLVTELRCLQSFDIKVCPKAGDSMAGMRSSCE